MPVLLPSQKTGPTPHLSQARRIGGWLPHNPREIRKHVKTIRQRATEAQLSIVEPIQALEILLNSNPTVYMLFTEMLTEVPNVWPYNQITGDDGQSEIRDLNDLIQILNYQIQSPINFNDSAQIGTPINAILDWPMATKAGFAAFLRDDVNKVFQDMLAYWGNFLMTDPKSVSTVTTGDGGSGDDVGWLSATAQSEEPGLRDFLNKYIVPDPNDAHYGFKTWDQFFTRQFKPDLRPVASPDDQNVITSAAESTPFYIQHNVQLRDTFWAKNPDVRTNYSLSDMLGDVGMAQKFVGGTVYQAFLSADSYHNWHAPVDGYYVQPTKIIPGTYYSEPLMWSFSPDDGPSAPDVGADALSQSYISAVAKRGVAYVQAKNPAIGLMAIVMVGMAEVSSVDFDQNLDYFNPEKGFKKGEQIGRFHFGGSSHCLIFGPNVKLTFAPYAVPSQDVTHPGVPVEVNSLLATVTH